MLDLCFFVESTAVATASGLRRRERAKSCAGVALQSQFAGLCVEFHRVAAMCSSTQKHRSAFGQTSPRTSSAIIRPTLDGRGDSQCRSSAREQKQSFIVTVEQPTLLTHTHTHKHTHSHSLGPASCLGEEDEAHHPRVLQPPPNKKDKKPRQSLY